VKKKHTDNQDLEGEDKDGGDSGGAGSVIIPNYRELLGIDVDEKQLTELAANALFEQRISVKSKGFDVTALSKMQKLRNQLNNPNTDPSMGGSGLALDEHPELADMGGDVDPNTIVLPESEAAERASNDPALQLKLRQRMAAKFGMSKDISLQSMQEEYKKKMEMRSRPRPQEPEPPRYRPAPKPSPR